MDDKYIAHYMSKQCSQSKCGHREHFGYKQYSNRDNILNHSIGKSKGISQRNVQKMPMDGEIVFPSFEGESRFIDTVKQRYPTLHSLTEKKSLAFVSRNDEF